MPAGILKRTGFSVRGKNPRAILLIGRAELSPVRFEVQKRRGTRLFSAISILEVNSTDWLAEKEGFELSVVVTELLDDVLL